MHHRPLGERLADDRGDAGLHRLVDERAGHARESDDRNITIGEDQPRRIDATEPGQAEVEQDHIGLVLAGELDRLDAVARVGADVESCGLEHEAQVGTNDRVVLDGENAGWKLLQGTWVILRGSSVSVGPGNEKRLRAQSLEASKLGPSAFGGTRSLRLTLAVGPDRPSR